MTTTAQQYGLGRHPAHVAADAISGKVAGLRAQLRQLAIRAEDDDAAWQETEALRARIAGLEDEMHELYAVDDDCDDEGDW